jgi:hypothetical protein
MGNQDDAPPVGGEQDPAPAAAAGSEGAVVQRPEADRLGFRRAPVDFHLDSPSSEEGTAVASGPRVAPPAPAGAARPEPAQDSSRVRSRRDSGSKSRKKPKKDSKK